MVKSAAALHLDTFYVRLIVSFLKIIYGGKLNALDNIYSSHYPLGFRDSFKFFRRLYTYFVNSCRSCNNIKLL